MSDAPRPQEADNSNRTDRPATTETATGPDSARTADTRPRYHDGRPLVDYATARSTFRQGTKIDRLSLINSLRDATTGNALQDGELLLDRVARDSEPDLRIAAMKTLTQRRDQDPDRAFGVFSAKLERLERHGRDPSEKVRKVALASAMELPKIPFDKKVELFRRLTPSNTPETQDLLVSAGEILLNDPELPVTQRIELVRELCYSRHLHVRTAGIRLINRVDEIGSQQAAALYRRGIEDPSATLATDRSAPQVTKLGSAITALKTVDEIVASTKLPMAEKLELLESGIASPHPSVQDRSVRACIALHKRQTMKYVSSTVRANAADDAVPNEDIRAWIDSVDQLSDAAKEVLKKRFP